MSTLIEAVWARADLTPRAGALVDGDTELGYADLREQVSRAAGLLSAEGVRPGDRIVVIGHNTVGWVIAYLAGLRLGAIVLAREQPTQRRPVPRSVRVARRVTVLFDDDHRELAEHTVRPRMRVEDPRRHRSPGTGRRPSVAECR
ncbi:hypothetical protein nbrc107696_45500 [Gordonia spumicola]|uniref:AMP-dependent synthetase/ligase domain-containing protein n=1 Tax=Gordonia spumicola TaxID=589161 RepID=A0A7I9VFH7_9ACTN|nr:AMP-binding protein [Gordonia spumicola]GEE04104.1 hypothetical protein nbrc107696_45500 [Gordonia spumicola]